MNKPAQKPALRNLQVNWKHVGIFLGLTFAITWGIDLALQLTSGYGANTTTTLFLQLQMLVPAYCAILLGRYFFTESPIFYRNYKQRPRWFFDIFMIFAALYVVLAIVLAFMPEQATMISAVASIANLLALVGLLGVRGFSKGEDFAKAGLKGGRWQDWVIYGAGFILFYLLQTGLNMAFGLGKAVDLAELFRQMTGSPANAPLPASPALLSLLLAVQMVLVGSLVGVIYGFGEEYGWRGYLQGELFKIGKRRGAVLLGVIWGVWHYPVILMGHNYPGQPVLGMAAMTAVTIFLGIVLSWVMLRSGSIWLVAFLHALNNQVLSYFTLVIYKPNDPIWSFGAGLFGVALMGVVAYFILRDPVWRDH